MMTLSAFSLAASPKVSIRFSCNRLTLLTFLGDEKRFVS